MKKYILIFLFLASFLWSTEKSVRLTESEYIELQKRLDLIMIEIRYLPDEKKRNIYGLVLDIKEILAGKPTRRSEKNVSQVQQYEKKASTDEDIKNFVQRLESLDKFEEKKVSIAAKSKTTRFYMRHVAEIIKLFPDSYVTGVNPEKRKEILKILLPDVIDPENFDLLINVLKEIAFLNNRDKDIENVKEILFEN